MHVEITENIFTNTDCMVHMPLLNLTYDGFVINGNGRRLEEADNGDDINQGIIKFDITNAETIKIHNFTAKNNHMR